jgi:hypothetical protein
MLSALLLALGVAAAPADTLPRFDVQAEYPRIYHLRPDADSTTGFSFGADSLPAGDPLAPLVNPNLLFFEFLGWWGTTPHLTDITRQHPGSAAVREFAAVMRRDTTFNAAFIGVAGRYLAARGIRAARYDPSRPRPAIPMSDVMELAARYFYPAAIRPDGSIETHICVATEGLGDLQRPHDLALEALIFAAIRREVATPRFGLREEFGQAARRMSQLDLSSDPRVRLTRAQGFLWGELARSSALRQTVLSEYRSLRDVLPFVIADSAPASP